MKKRLLCLGLVAVFAISALAFAGCGGADEKAELEKQLSAVQSVVQRQETEISELEKLKAELQKQIDGLNERVEELEEKIKDLEGKETGATIYTLERAYEDGLLTREDILHIAYFSMADETDKGFYSDDVLNFVPTMPTPELTEQEEEMILRAYCDLFRVKYEDRDRYHVNITHFLGNYKGTYAVCIYSFLYDYEPPTRRNYYDFMGIRFKTANPGLMLFRRKEADSEGTKMYGTFYNLDEAYEKGVITRESIQLIADHPYPYDQEHFPKLENEIERKILHDYDLLGIPRNERLSVEFYGSYNGCYAVRIRNPQYDPIQDVVWPFDIAGIKFYMGRPFIQIWKPVEQ